MACGGSNDLLPHQTKHQVKQKTIVNIHLLCRVKYSCNTEDQNVKTITIKISKTSGTSFDEGCIAVNISQLLDKKIITNVKAPQHLDSFHLSITEISSEDNLPLQMEEIILDDTQQWQQNTQFIRILLDDIINNALGN